MRVSKPNLPQDVPLRWNVEKAAVEFGLSIMALRKAVNKTSAESDRAVYSRPDKLSMRSMGSLAVEKLATQKELRRKLELENAVTTASVLKLRGIL